MMEYLLITIVLFIISLLVFSLVAALVDLRKNLKQNTTLNKQKVFWQAFRKYFSLALPEFLSDLL